MSAYRKSAVDKLEARFAAEPRFRVRLVTVTPLNLQCGEIAPGEHTLVLCESDYRNCEREVETDLAALEVAERTCEQMRERETDLVKRMAINTQAELQRTRGITARPIREFELLEKLPPQNAADQSIEERVAKAVAEALPGAVAAALAAMGVSQPQPETKAKTKS